MSVASELAEVDIARASSRPFSLGTRPVIRWIKGDGRDDEVTRSAIAQATRVFGDRVDYCMCSAGISAARARAILAWSDQPVEWWPLGPEDNLQLARMLMAAGCPVDAFGYWWKWFPERVRPAAPEWILDGDMVITGKPSWFDGWCAGTDRLRISSMIFGTSMGATANITILSISKRSCILAWYPYHPTCHICRTCWSY